MGAFSVVPEKPVDEGLVEGCDVVTKECEIALNEVLRDRSIEPLNGTIHLGAPWVGVVVSDTESLTGSMEVVGKLRAIVCLYLRYLEWCYGNEFGEEVCCGLGGMLHVCSPEGKAVFEVDGGVDVALR